MARSSKASLIKGGRGTLCLGPFFRARAQVRLGRLLGSLGWPARLAACTPPSLDALASLGHLWRGEGEGGRRQAQPGQWAAHRRRSQLYRGQRWAKPTTQGRLYRGRRLGIAKWSLDFPQLGGSTVQRTEPCTQKFVPNDLGRTVQRAVGLHPMGGGQGWVRSTQWELYRWAYCRWVAQQWWVGPSRACTVRRSLCQTIWVCTEGRAHKMGARGVCTEGIGFWMGARGQLAQFRTKRTKRGPGVRGLWAHFVDPTGIQNLNGTACRAQWAQATVQTHPLGFAQWGAVCVVCVVCSRA